MGSGSSSGTEFSGMIKKKTKQQQNPGIKTFGEGGARNKNFLDEIPEFLCPVEKEEENSCWELLLQGFPWIWERIQELPREGEEGKLQAGKIWGKKKKKSQFQAPAEDPQDLGRDWNLGMHRNWGIRWNLGNLGGVKFGNAPGIWEFLQFGNCKLGIL